MRKKIILGISLLVVLLAFSLIFINGTKFEKLRNNASLTTEQRFNTIKVGETGVVILYKESCKNCKRFGGVVAEILESRGFSLTNDVSYTEISNKVPPFLEIIDSEIHTPYILVFGKDKSGQLKYFFRGSLSTVEEQKGFISEIDKNFQNFSQNLD